MHELGKQGKSSVIFSYEMGWREVAKIFGGMDVVDGVKTELPVYIPTELHSGGGELHFQWLFEAIAKAKEEKGITLAVIDHLHFLLPLKDYQNTSFLLGGIVREIKKIATILQVPIILIAHTQKIQDDKVPDWTMIRDSSFITQEADVVMMMYRIKSKEAAKKQSDESTEEVYLNKTILSVELNRMGGTTGKVKLRHNGAKFVEMTEMDEVGDFVKKNF
jgi:RecA-family ATPase